jgi:hypothetical protein
MHLTTEKTHDPLVDNMTFRIRTVRRWRYDSAGMGHGAVIGQVTKQGKEWAWRRFSLSEGKWVGGFESMKAAMEALAKAVE